jgi:hypothetical protein
MRLDADVLESYRARPRLADPDQRRPAPRAQTEEGVDRQDFAMTKDTSFGSADMKREEQEAKLAVLRAALVEGEASGPAAAFDFDRFIACKRKAVSSAL